MADDDAAAKQTAPEGPRPEPAEQSGSSPAKETARFALNTAVRKTFAALTGLSGTLGAIAVFTAPFTRNGSALVTVTIAVFAALLLLGTGASVLMTVSKRKITASLGLLAGLVILAVGIGAGGGYLIWHVRTTTSPPAAAHSPSAPVTVDRSAPASVTQSTVASPNPSTGFTAEVDWTNDGGGGGSTSTTLYSYAGPNSEIHEGAYPLGQQLTVICEVSNGRAVQVGPDYTGPDPTSTMWYQLDDNSWVPAVYVHVDDVSAVPTCG